MEWLKPVGFTLFPHIGGIAGAVITSKNVKTWYENTLRKPTWKPPNWVFAPVWLSLYTGMGYASYLVWRDGGGFGGKARNALMLYGGQLALNWAWTPLFFGLHKIGPAAVELSVLVGAVGACVAVFYPINQTASYIMIPYLAWVTFASVLNWSIYNLNKKTRVF